MVAADVTLPLGPPLVRSYLFHAFPMAILAGRGDGPASWILSTFVQLYHRPGGELKFYVHPLSPAPHLRQVLALPCPWLEVQPLDPRLLNEPRAHFLARSLRQGLYPQVDVDHGWLPEDGRQGFVHEVLLTGVRGHVEAFQVCGYDAHGRFGRRWIPAARLDAAMRAVDDTHGPGVCPAREPRWFLYRVADGRGAPLDLEAIATQLWDYVESADTSRRYRAIWPAVGGRWGLDALTWLAEALRAGQSELTLPLCVLWEHKRLMALRLTRLEADGHLDTAARASSAAREITRDAWALRLAHLRHRQGDRCAAPGHADTAYTGPDDDGSAFGETAAARVLAIAARELELYGAVLERLGATGRAAAA